MCRALGRVCPDAGARSAELGTLSRQRIAALVGVAFNRDSGTLQGAAPSGAGAPQSCLYMSTLVAVKHNPVLKAFYVRLCAVAKPESGPDGLYAQVADDPQRHGETSDPLATTGGSIA